MGEFTPKQQKFIEAYAGNGVEACRAAGYSETGIRVTAHRLLTNPNIRAAIEKRNEGPQMQRIMSRVERQALWTRIALGEEEGADMKDRLKATELLGRSEADFTEKIQADMKVNVTRKEYKKSN